MGDSVDSIRTAYATPGPALELGAAVVDGAAHPDVPVRLPLAMLNRHGLVAGATGTGKTKTLQLMAEQLSDAGVPVFLADIKGDVSGLGAAGSASERITTRAADTGTDWQPRGFPCEFLSLGGRGAGIPVRATVTAFGPLLLSKVLGLNDTQESSLGLVFHYADRAGLPLLDLKDLRAVVSYLVSAEGKDDLKGLGGLSSATAGVILRELIGLESAGGDAFFGEPEFDTADLLRTTPEGRGVLSVMGLAAVQENPRLFSTFLMWLLADLFQDLPEVGDLDQPKLVFFFDEAHLLFADASRDFLDAITRTVRLIRSKGVGIVFVTQAPTDVPAAVLAQLGNRVQHALRAFTPDDAKALRATVGTFPTSTPVRPDGAAAGARDRRGGRHGAVRARHADADRLDPAAAAGLADGAARPGRAAGRRRTAPSCSRSTAPRSTGTRRTSGCWRGWRRSRNRSGSRLSRGATSRSRGATSPSRGATSPRGRGCWRACSARACSAASPDRPPARPAGRSAARCSGRRRAGGAHRADGAPPGAGDPDPAEDGTGRKHRRSRPETATA